MAAARPALTWRSAGICVGGDATVSSVELVHAASLARDGAVVVDQPQGPSDVTGSTHGAAPGA